MIEPIKRRYIRNSNEEEFNNEKMLIYKGVDEQYDDKAFVPVEIKAGKNIFRRKNVKYFYLIQAMLFLFMVK